MATTKKTPSPKDLGPAGRKLWREITLEFQFDSPIELNSLRHSCLLEDDLARLRTALETAPLLARGSMGQDVESPLLASIRQAVALQARLLASIAVEGDSGAASRSHAGRALASQRWAAK